MFCSLLNIGGLLKNCILLGIVLAFSFGHGMLFAQYVSGGINANARNAPQSAQIPAQIPPQTGTAPGPASIPRSAPQPTAAVDTTVVAGDIQGTIKRLLAANERRIPNIAECAPGDVLAYAFPYGSQAMVYVPPGKGQASGSGQSVYAIGALCWNFPCRGKTLFRIAGDQVIARVGAGYQPCPGSFLAMLALSEIVPTYEIKAGNESRTLANLIETEKLNCVHGQNLAMTLVGLSFYLRPNDHWTNSLGEDWSLERLVTEELSRRADQSQVDVTNQLLGLSAAVQTFRENGSPLNGPIADAQVQLDTYQRFIFSVQNSDGTWHPMFFVNKGASGDADGVLFATAHILRFLVFSLPKEQLNDPRISKAVNAVATMISRRPVNVPLSQLSDKQLEGTTVGLHALKIYRDRMYGKEATPE